MSQSISGLVAALDNPRASRDDYRRSPANKYGASVTLVGVVHDHPASVFRAASTVAELAPDVLAVEVAPVALPLFASYAREHAAADAGLGNERSSGDEQSPDDERIPGGEQIPGNERIPGGEMTAAMAAAGDARIVGIDLPNASGFRAAIDVMRSEPLSVYGIGRAVRAFTEQTAHAARCRVAHVAARYGIDVDPGLDRPRSGERWSSPAAQAAAERDALTAGTALLRSFTRPPSMAAFDGAREVAMAKQLHALRREGPVVAVVGHAHLDPIAAHLDDGQ